MKKGVLSAETTDLVGAVLVKLFAVVSMFEGRECVLKELGQCVSVDETTICVSIAQSKPTKKGSKERVWQSHTSYKDQVDVMFEQRLPSGRKAF